MSETLIAVDIGNSRIKLGRFDRAADDKARLPVPLATLQLPLVDRAGNFDQPKLAAWADALPADCRWLVASVHRGAARKLIDAVGKRPPVELLTQSDVPIEVNLPAPERVGIDRLVAAAAADRLRQPGHSAIVVDHGSAITIDLVDAQGAFAGGAILPGIAMGAQALSDHTDALPTVAIDTLSNATLPIGDSTVTAIEAGLYWGTFGAVRELVQRIADRQSGTPDVFVTGGAAAALAEGLAEHTRLVVQHVPHLVLAGVALVAEG